MYWLPETRNWSFEIFKYVVDISFLIHKLISIYYTAALCKPPEPPLELFSKKSSGKGINRKKTANPVGV